MADEQIQVAVKAAAPQIEAAVKRLSWVSALLSDSGAVSSSRLVMLITAAIVLVKCVAFNVAALIHGGAPVGFDPTDIGILGTVMGGKVLQSVFAEGKK